MKSHKRALLLPWAGGDSTMAYTNKVLALSPIAYWPLAESSGSVADNAEGTAARDGTYTAVTLGATGIGDGRTAASFDGSTSYCNVFSNSLNTALDNHQEGTAAGWVKVSAAGVWTDATFRVLWETVLSGSNAIQLQKSTSNNTFSCIYIAGGTNKTVNIAVSSTAWLHFAITWSKANDQVIAYMNGTQSGATLTGVGTWSGTPTKTFIGADTTTPSRVWSGTIAHVAIWNTPLSAAQVLTLATVP